MLLGKQHHLKNLNAKNAHAKREPKKTNHPIPGLHLFPSPTPLNLLYRLIYRRPTHSLAPPPSAAVRAGKLTDLQRLLPTHFQPPPCNYAVRSRPRSQARSSPAAPYPHPFPATPLHPRRLQPSAQPSSLICSGFFSPPISSQSLAPTPSAAVRAGKLAHPQRPLLPTHFQPLPCTHAVRSRPRSQARSSPAASSPPFSPPIASHPLATTPSAAFIFLPFPSFPFLSLSFPSFPLHSHPTRLNN